MDTRIDSRQQDGPPSGGIRAMAWLLLATIVAAAAALLGATPAAAVIKEAEYRVVIDATAHWKLARKIEERTGSNYSRVQIEASAHFDATIENVLFRDGKLITDGHWGKAHFNLNGSGDTNYFRWVTNPQPPHFETQHGFCNAQDDRFGAGTASISRWPEGYDPARGERLRVRIAE